MTFNQAAERGVCGMVPHDPPLPLCPEAHHGGTRPNPNSGDWPSTRNNPLCGSWWLRLKRNNP